MPTNYGDTGPRSHVLLVPLRSVFGLRAPVELVELLIAIIILLFGAKRVPELARGLGSGVREFKKAINGISEPDEDEESEKKETKAES